jgi:hypothetical protein
VILYTPSGYVSHVNCTGCDKPIDPAFDSVSNDDEGRPWHTACRVDKVGAQDQNINPNADLMAGSPPSPSSTGSGGASKPRRPANRNNGNRAGARFRECRRQGSNLRTSD